MTDNNKPPKNATSHYFSDSPKTASRRTEFTIKGPRGELTLTADTGVFSQYGLDKGTAVLLEAMAKHAPAELSAGTALCDLGCGTGAIALTLASLYPQCVVYAIDINERARELCADNAKRNGLTNVLVQAPTDVDPELRFQLLWSNPPIRIGKNALHELLLTWLARLDTEGVAHLVVSKNLGADSLADWLTENKFPASKLGSSKGFRVLQVVSER
jgi:16S rRNA (guanine1207-N2)-methyltransferase